MTPTRHNSVKKATFLQLTFMIYGAACAGAFGLEDMISTAGPGVAIITLILMPFLFSVPVSFAVAELTTMMPLEGGQYRWSRAAFGDFWGFQAGWWSWMSAVVTNSLFAVLFTDYLKSWLPQVAGGFPHWLSCLALIWVLHYLNVRGIDVVGKSAILLSLILLLPFVLMLGLGIAQWQHNPFTPMFAPDKNLLTGFGSALILAIWLYSGYDKLSAAAEEVENPRRVFPPALLFAAALAMLSYVLPTIAGLAALGNWQEWKVPYFATAAGLMAGPWLGHLMTFGGLCSNALLLNVTMLAASRYPFTLAQDGFLPKRLTRIHESFGTPTLALLFGSVTYSLLALFDFSQLLIIYSWFQMSSNLLLYANVWAMRRTHAGLPRPFKIPFGKPGMFLAMIPTCVIALLAMGSAVWSEGALDAKQFLIASAALLSGPAVYFGVQQIKRAKTGSGKILN
jgi:amino acid transporter